MKTEEFLSLILNEVLGVDKREVDKHFKEFRKSHRQFPLIIGSLEQEVVDNDGNSIKDNCILQLVEELKQQKLDSPKEFWRGFVQSQTWFPINRTYIYLREIGTQLRFAIFCYKNYLIAKNVADSEAVFLHTHHFLVHIANVDKLIDKLIIPSNSINAKLASQIIDFSDIELKLYRTARNHLEHFEERLDAWLYLYAGSPFFDCNLVDSGTKDFPENRALRAIQSDEDLFMILGERFDLGVLYHQVCLLADKVTDILDEVG